MSSFCDFYIEYGEARGEIKGVIRHCYKQHMTVNEIIDSITDEFDISREEAEKYVDETLQLEVEKGDRELFPATLSPDPCLLKYIHKVAFLFVIRYNKLKRMRQRPPPSHLKK